MIKFNTLATIAAPLLALGALQPAFGDDAAPRAALSSHQQDSAELIVNVQQALSRYQAACAARDREGLSDSLTSFAVVEYATPVAGQFDAVDAHSTDKCWTEFSFSGDHAPQAPIAMYPTNERNVVLIQYSFSIGTGSRAKTVQDIALIELDGDRIARIRDHLASAPRTERSRHCW